MSPPFHRGGVLGGRGVRSDSADGCGRPNSPARVPAGEASSGSRPAPAGVQVLRSEQLNTRGGTAALRRPLRRRGGRDLAVRVARVVVTTPSGDAGRRALGAFLRSRRERLSPDDVGICDSSRRRTPGLRREEVAALCYRPAARRPPAPSADSGPAPARPRAHSLSPARRDGAAERHCPPR